MARVMRSKINKTDSENFGFTAMNSGDFRANIPFLVKGIFGHIPLKRVKNVKIEFKKPSKIALQIEGEVYRITDVKTLEVRISKEKIKVL
jgi:diacylglycerol kinase family enzyme